MIWRKCHSLLWFPKAALSSPPPYPTDSIASPNQTRKLQVPLGQMGNDFQQKQNDGFDRYQSRFRPHSDANAPLDPPQTPERRDSVQSRSARRAPKPPQNGPPSVQNNVSFDCDVGVSDKPLSTGKITKVSNLTPFHIPLKSTHFLLTLALYPHLLIFPCVIASDEDLNTGML